MYSFTALSCILSTGYVFYYCVFEYWTFIILGDLLPLNQSPENRMRRSMSFERVATSYLSGEWPRTCNLHNNRLNLVRCHAILTTDKWTQVSSVFIDLTYRFWAFVIGGGH